MRLLLDSHVFVWVKGAPENLSDEARAAIIDPDHDVFVSPASSRELWLKHSRKSVVELAPVLDGGASALSRRQSSKSLLSLQSIRPLLDIQGFAS